MNERRRIFSARKILVASATGVAGAAAVGYFLLSKQASENANFPTGNLMPPPPLPHDAGPPAPQLPIGTEKLRMAAKGDCTLVRVRIDSAEDMQLALVVPQASQDLPTRELTKLINADKRFAPGNTYVIAYMLTGSGKTKPFQPQIIAIDDTGDQNVAAYRRIIEAEKTRPKCDCPPGDPLCECL